MSEKTSQELWDEMDAKERNASMEIFGIIHEAVVDVIEECAKLIESHVPAGNRSRWSDAECETEILIKKMAKEIRALKHD
jgi:CRISPR/Cas system-associated exonuclease Cas4 (RecB family)